LLSACSSAELAQDVGAPLVATTPPAPVTVAEAAPRPAPEPATRGVIGRGFAQVSGQPGATLGERRLLAVRAARLDAVRDLAEQVRGIRLDVETLVDDAVVRDDRLSASIDTTLRGARTVSIQPRGEDGYEVVMELDAASVALVLRMARAGA
jgi:hypothetical protein